MALSPSTRRVLSEVGSWALLAGAATACILFFDDIKQVAGPLLGAPPAQTAFAATPARTRSSDGEPRSSNARVEIRAGENGHFFAAAEVNGRPLNVMVDSGASIVAMTYDDARRAGVSVRDSDFTQAVRTANGIARVAPVVLDRVSIGDVTVRNVPAAVAEDGKLHMTLLGMSFLSRLQRVDMRPGVLLPQE
mgnify:FL=1